MNKEAFETIIAFPAFEIDGNDRRKRPPVNVLPMAACVEKQGISSIRVIDGESLGLPPELLAEEILKNYPQIVGVSVYTPAYPRVKELTARVKELRPEVMTVLGGKHPTHCYPSVLTDPNVDFVVVGEGEIPLQKLISARKINSTAKGLQDSLAQEPGIAYNGRKEVPLANRVNLKDLPPINWKVLYPGLEYYLQSEDNFLIESARGCFGNCVFCLAAGYRKGISFKPPDRFVDELLFLVSRGFHRFFLTDDDVMVNINHISEIFKDIRDLSLDVAIEVNARVDSLLRCTKKDPDFLNLAKSAGLKVIHLGIESGSPEILEYCRKGIDLDQVKDVINITSNFGLVVESNFIIGLPYDSKETINQSIKFALELRQYAPHVPHVSIFMPYPGTQAYDDAIKEGLLDPRTLDLSKLHVHQGAIIPTKHLTKEQINSLYNEFHDRYYTKEYLEYLNSNYPKVFNLTGRLMSKRLKSDD